MRFNAKVATAKRLLKVVQIIMKIKNDCILHIAPDATKFIITSDANDTMQVWTEAKTYLFFEETVIASLNHNMIAMQIQLHHLKQVLQSAVNVNGDTLVRLRKKDGSNVPFLTFTITQSSRSLFLTQDIPVVVLSAQILSGFVEPVLPTNNLNFFMPALKHVQNVVEKMKNISDHLTIEVNTNSTQALCFSVETGTGSIKTFYDISYPELGNPIPPDVSATVKVDIKKFLKTLQSHQIEANHVVCCVYEGSSLVLHVMQRDLTISYYLPLIY
ncbi:checkpoint clamp complex protein [Heterostelium album PN500]|uniref:Checkpoint protein n=1 Tax=Heterostelium pallidum (strain ATCC 26659 / Pp 5 / PN500) TaxID=670386 RepID=D3BR17_HETP5|nr:checkpoint clamp complex protein [Heterostelium album PN500]EFA75849.1 checkpoint clamp complex protein [Heterostelium album PN500]|eukprot:XP_020427983.1 checkpoint clamp complex protein [Heterostelium album PN500]